MNHPRGESSGVNHPWVSHLGVNHPGVSHPGLNHPGVIYLRSILTIEIRFKPMYEHRFSSFEVESFTGIDFEIGQTCIVITGVRMFKITAIFRFHYWSSSPTRDTFIITITGNDVTTGLTCILCRILSPLE